MTNPIKSQSSTMVPHCRNLIRVEVFTVRVFSIEKIDQFRFNSHRFQGFLPVGASPNPLYWSKPCAGGNLKSSRGRIEIPLQKIDDHGNQNIRLLYHPNVGGPGKDGQP